jgi:hypothetical protein
MIYAANSVRIPIGLISYDAGVYRSVNILAQ